MKQCPDCRREGTGPKPYSEFSKATKRRDGYQDYCIPHQRARNSAAHKRRSPEVNRANGKRWREQNPVAYRAIAVRANLQRYGLTEQQYQELFDTQRGCCAICDAVLVNLLDKNRPFKGVAHNDVSRVDHCHETGRVRGLLCFSCNVGLGKFRDDEQLLLKAMQYLQATPRKQASGTATNFNRWCGENAQGEKRADESRDLVTSTSRGSRLDLSPFFN